MSGSKVIKEDIPTPSEEEVEEALKAAEKGPREVNMGCRRSLHLDGRPGAASGDGDLTGTCDGTRALVMSDILELPDGHSMYRCTSCGYQWSVATGGNFSY